MNAIVYYLIKTSFVIIAVYTCATAQVSNLLFYLMRSKISADSIGLICQFVDLLANARNQFDLSFSSRTWL